MTFSPERHSIQAPPGGAASSSRRYVRHTGEIFIIYNEIRTKADTKTF